MSIRLPKPSCLPPNGRQGTARKLNDRVISFLLDQLNGYKWLVYTKIDEPLLNGLKNSFLESISLMSIYMVAFTHSKRTSVRENNLTLELSSLIKDILLGIFQTYFTGPYLKINTGSQFPLMKSSNNHFSHKKLGTVLDPLGLHITLRCCQLSLQNI